MKSQMPPRRLLILTLVGLSFTAAHAKAGSPTASCCRGPVRNRVYVFRGAVGYWPKLNTMVDRLKRSGYEPEVYFFSQTNHAVDKLIERRRSGEEAGPVRLVGYSLGAHGACNMAMQLKPHGICVDRLMLIECFTNPTLTSNVRCCFNLYETRRMDSWNIFRGTPVMRESRRTRLVNLDVATNPHWREQRKCNHFNMPDNARVQNTIVHLLSCNCIWRHQPSRSCAQP